MEEGPLIISIPVVVVTVPVSIPVVVVTVLLSISVVVVSVPVFISVVVVAVPVFIPVVVVSVLVSGVVAFKSRLDNIGSSAAIIKISGRVALQQRVVILKLSSIQHNSNPMVTLSKLSWSIAITVVKFKSISTASGVVVISLGPAASTSAPNRPTSAPNGPTSAANGPTSAANGAPDKKK